MPQSITIVVPANDLNQDPKETSVFGGIPRFEQGKSATSLLEQGCQPTKMSADRSMATAITKDCFGAGRKTENWNLKHQQNPAKYQTLLLVHAGQATILLPTKDVAVYKFIKVFTLTLNLLAPKMVSKRPIHY